MEFTKRYGLTEDAVMVLHYRYQALCASGDDMAWKSFDDFLWWCSDKWDYGMRLIRENEHEPYGPSNCRWVNSNSNDFSHDRTKDFVQKWDRMTSEIRKKYPVELRQISDGNCKQYFRYEHPDLVREGILFIGNNPE